MVAAIIGVPMSSAIAGNTADQEGPEVNSIPTVKVTIQKKVIEAVITSVGDRFTISEETIITGMNGEQMSIRELLVPCDAEITYQTEKGKRVAQRIKTYRLNRSNSWKWGADKPE
jgi:hypothetical protein